MWLKISEGINEGLKSLLEAIQSNTGIKAKDLVAVLNHRPIKTIERQVKELTEMEYIERKGSKKPGVAIAFNFVHQILLLQ